MPQKALEGGIAPMTRGKTAGHRQTPASEGPGGHATANHFDGKAKMPIGRKRRSTLKVFYLRNNIHTNMSQKKFRITQADFMLANRKAARDEEIREHGRPKGSLPTYIC